MKRFLQVAFVCVLFVGGLVGAAFATHTSVTELHPWSETISKNFKGVTVVQGTITDLDPIPHPETVTVTTTVGTTTAPPPPPPAPVSQFVTRSGNKLSLAGNPYTFTGFNVYGANTSWAESWGQCGYNWNDGDNLSQAFAQMGTGNEVVRAWFFQHMATRSGVRDWSHFDKTIAVAKQHGKKIMPVIADQWGGCDPGYGYKSDAWYAGGYRNLDPAGTVSYRQWTIEIAQRYRDDPTVFAWQLINEGQDCDVAGFRNWAADVSGAIKSVDPNHLVSIGTIGDGNCGAANDEYKQLHSISTVDFCEYHDYGGGANPIPGDQWNGMQVRINQCNELNKPLFVGESGIGRNEVGTLQDRANAFETKLQAQLGAGIVGVVAWQWWNGSAGLSDGYEIGPGDPTVAVFGKY